MANVNKPTQGETFGFEVESALGTNANSWSEIRFNEKPEFPTNTRQGINNPNMGHSHPANMSDKPIWIEKYQEGALSFSTHIRGPASVDGTPPIATFFESMGCNVSTNTTDATVDTYTSDVLWTLSADPYVPSGATSAGDTGLMELNSGVYYPSLLASYTKATKTCVPGMALPSASLATNEWQQMTTIWPYSRQVPSNKTLSFYSSNRGQFADDTGDENLAFEITGCAVSTVGELVLKPFEPPTLSFTCHVGKVDIADSGADALAAETFVDTEKFAIVNDDFKFEFANASASGAIARNDGILGRNGATVTWGVKSVPIIGEGSGTYAGMQGYVLVFEAPKVQVSGLFNVDSVTNFWDQMEGSNTSKYIGLVQPTRSLTTPAFGFWAPNAHLDGETPPTIDRSGDMLEYSATYVCSSAGYDSDTLASEAGAAPWYFGVSGDNTA